MKVFVAYYSATVWVDCPSCDYEVALTVNREIIYSDRNEKDPILEIDSEFGHGCCSCGWENDIHIPTDKLDFTLDFSDYEERIL